MNTQKEIRKTRDELDKLEAKLSPQTKWTKIGDLKWSEPLGEMTWDDACEKCKQVGGRLPTRIELIDLVDNHSEEIKDWDTGLTYWSATTLFNYTHYAWFTYLGNGDTHGYGKTYSRYVRCVR